MVKKYVLTKKKMRPTLEWLSGQRKWPKDTKPDMILSAGVLPRLGGGYQRKQETK